ncbi:MAG: hypothetical protein JWM46_407 [Candidatus Kaiserbacteria bacterium]|nr:hypothetical protein [Candidatus Kaiserbacteria bacterium]
MRVRVISSIIAVALFAPVLASAASIFDTVSLANTLLNSLIGLFITAAIVALFWGIVKYLFSGGGEDKTEGLKIAMYGVVAIFLMVSIWGIIRLLQNTFKVTSTDPIIPQGIQVNTVTSY